MSVKRIVLFPRCTINQNLCGNNPCKYGGSCVDSGNGVRYTCICQPGYTGDNCDTNISECWSLLLLLICPVTVSINAENDRKRDASWQAGTARQAGRQRQTVGQTNRDEERNQTDHKTLILNAS